MSDFISRLQQLPVSTRVRILWVTVAVVAAGLVVIWAVNLKSQVSRLGADQNGLLSSLANNLSQEKRITAEWSETGDGKIKIYFKIKNDTDDILNFPALSDIKLKTEDKETAAESVTDRQGRAFVKRVLSKTENYGVAVFAKPDNDKATLLFDQMYFEMKPTQVFSEQIKINFNDLNQAPELRK